MQINSLEQIGRLYLEVVGLQELNQRLSSENEKLKAELEDKAKGKNNEQKT